MPGMMRRTDGFLIWMKAKCSKAVKVEGVQNFTQPPARFTEASLVKDLEEKDIGRPSTYAPIVATLIDRKYISKEKNH